MSQSQLAFLLQMAGFDVGREVIAQIEAQTHCLKDKDVPFFALVLKVEVAELYHNKSAGQHSVAAIVVWLQAAIVKKGIGKVVMNSLQPPQNKSDKTKPNIMEASQSNTTEPPPRPERISYSIHEAAEMLGVDYFSVYRLIQRGKLKACRALRGKFLIPKTELFRLLNNE